MTDWEAVRAEFPALRNWTYLNTATFGQLPRRGTEAVARHFAHRNELACSDFLAWFEEIEHIRESIGKLISASADDIAFIPNASSGLSLFLSGLDWKPGDRVVTLDDEFPNQLYALGDLARRGVEFVHCPWSRLHETVTDRTRVVALSSANYNNGFVPPIEEISPYLRERGALLYVDGTQSVGALRFDTARVQPDMLCVHGYKWLLSPNGAGFVYVRPELRARLHPNIIGWRSHHDWRSVDNLHHGAPVFSHRAEKYEGGGIAFALLYAMGASVDLMLEIGPQAIEERVLHLADLTRAVLRDLGANVADGRTAIVAAQFENLDPSNLAAALKKRRVLVAARKGHLRVSPHFYNNEADIDVFRQELRALVNTGGES